MILNTGLLKKINGKFYAEKIKSAVDNSKHFMGTFPFGT